MNNYLFSSRRLEFRAFEEADLPAFISMNQDPEVMEHFPSLMSPKDTWQFYHRIRAHHKEYGYCFFAVDRLDTHTFIGFIGFSHPRFESFFTPCVEIGWRLASSEWGRGLATEGAHACLDYGFGQLGFEEVFSFTTTTNKASERVMQKIGMVKVGEFGHPLLEEDSPLYRHVLYRIGKP